LIKDADIYALCVIISPMLKVRPFYITVWLLLICIYSCDRVKRKSQQAVDKAHAKIAEKKADIGDKLITRYDAYTPDTRFNKKRFQEFFGFAPTADVKELYCHADEMGIDHDYQFSFTCNTSTVTKIISKLALVKADQPDNFSSGLWHSFPWWDSTSISVSKPYFKKGDHETYWYLWYDHKKSKAYYFEFDM
jgi:hypothetical protein